MREGNSLGEFTLLTETAAALPEVEEEGEEEHIEAGEESTGGSTVNGEEGERSATTRRKRKKETYTPRVWKSACPKRGKPAAIEERKRSFPARADCMERSASVFVSRERERRRFRRTAAYLG
jgi:hypothetical protein